MCVVCVGQAFLTAAINFARVFYYNHVSLLGSDSCVAASFTVIPVETAQCEENHKAERADSFPIYTVLRLYSMHDAADFGYTIHRFSFYFEASLTLKCLTWSSLTVNQSKETFL